MQDDGRQPSYNASVGSSFFGEEASTTLWTTDGGDDDIEDDTTRVIWKASQPQDPALNRLMEDAYIPRKPQRISQIKNWTPSPNSCSFATALTSATTSDAMERTARAHRTLKRRASSTAPLREASTSTRPDTSLEKDIQKLLALLPIVSKQVDENALREHEALKEKRRKQKKAARLTPGSSVTKKHKSPTDMKGKRRIADAYRDEEEMTATEELSTCHGHQSGQGSPRGEVAHRTAGASQSVSPPPFVPLRRARSNDGSFSNLSVNQHDRSTSTLNRDEGSAEELYFTPSSFIATSTPRPLSVTGSIEALDEPRAEKPAKEREEEDATAITTATSASTPAPSNPTGSRALSRSLSSSSGWNDTPYNDPSSTPTIPGARTSVPQAPAPRLGGYSHPKPSGPPVLGMRRLPNSQALPPSQNRPLPIKQDKFKVPFAKPKSEMDYRNSDSNSNRVSVTGTTKHQHPSRTNSTASSSSSTSARESASTSQVGFVRASSSSLSSSNSQTVKDEKSPEVIDSRCSPPVVDADSSIDYDMDIDPEELERVCSAYD